MHDAEAQELGGLEAGNHSEDSALLRPRKVGLEPDEVIGERIRRLRAELNRGPWAMPRPRVGKPDRLKRSKAYGVTPGAGDLLDRLARAKKVLLLEVATDHAGGSEERVDKGLVLIPIHRAIEIVSGPLLIARLGEGN